MEQKYPQIKCNLCGNVIPNAVQGIAIQICEKCIKDKQKIGVMKDSII